MQGLYGRDPPVRILDGKDAIVGETPPMEVFEGDYRDIFSAPQHPPEVGIPGEGSSYIYAPITEEEVERVLQQVKDQTAGSDGITTHDLRKRIQQDLLYCYQKEEIQCYSELEAGDDHQLGTSMAKKSLTVLADVNLTNAFKKVCIELIVKALHTVNIDHETIEFITAMYKDASTILELRNVVGHTGYEKGSDPTSGLLFNMVLDPLLQAMGNREGIIIGNIKVTAQAFTNDVVLLAKDVAMMRGHLEVLENSWKATLWNSQLEIQGKTIVMLEVGTQLCYLGQFYEDRDLTKKLLRLQKVPLKPWKKLSALNQFLIPWLYHRFMYMDVTAKKLRNCDRLIRIFAKKILHLPIATPDAYLCMLMQSGELSIPCLLQLIGSSYQSRLAKLKRSRDAQVVAALETKTGLSLQELTRMVKPE
ncbi:hypothetical protein PR048_019592 [Dryococelus australis]|uniref:Reverse transcriptase domain-containing protein n=1 Tax=Dryococelus australis TaxID=614101 RepID=A0ABQ9H3W2_9NEOP|nr:hypothetical protein PR048_019592 [Dryococelus australis]